MRLFSYSAFCNGELLIQWELQVLLSLANLVKLVFLISLNFKLVGEN